MEWGDGPLVVIAGAGTGKMRVIVERVRHLLLTRGDVTIAPDGTLQASYPSAGPSTGDTFAGPLLPEQTTEIRDLTHMARHDQRHLIDVVHDSPQAKPHRRQHRQLHALR